MELEQIKQQLAAIQKMCSDVMSQIEKLPPTNQEVKQQNVQVVSDLGQQVPLSPHLAAIKTLIDSQDWPAAVPPQLICDDNNEQDKFNRAKGIVSVYLDELVENKKVLDFGTGEGHLPLAVKLANSSVAVGYDIYDKFAVGNDSGLVLTSDWQKVMQNGPYDIITMFDVADHLVNETIVNVLLNLKSVLAPGGKIYVRYHPFISRHGGHLYKKLNKAFVHLVLSSEEIKQIIPDYIPDKFTGIVDPVRIYSSLPAMAGLIIQKENIQQHDVEPYFEQSILLQRILENTGYNSFPRDQMKIEFVDHVYVAQ